MSLPGFTAEVSVYQTTNVFQSSSTSSQNNQTISPAGCDALYYLCLSFCSTYDSDPNCPYRCRVEYCS